MSYDSPHAYDDGYLEAQYERWMETIDEVMPHVYRAFEGRTLTLPRPEAKEVIEIAHEADDPEWSFNYDRMIEELFALVSEDYLVGDYDAVYDTLEEHFPLRP